MNLTKILLVYKRSSLSVAGKFSERLRLAQRFQENHRAHYATLRAVERVLKDLNVKYSKHTRGPKVDYKDYDLIITIGGDGTVMEAGRAMKNDQLLLGVNSDPSWSVGQFCATHAGGFRQFFNQVIRGKAKAYRLYKLKIDLKDDKMSRQIECLNDALICHANPGAMSRYTLTVGKTSEHHRNSGIWLSTAAGSTGAILSAGGRKMPLSSTDIQYKPRELYHARGIKYRLTGGLIHKGQAAEFVSSMPHGCVFVDGAHIKFPFVYGAAARISTSSNYLSLIHA